MRRYTIRYRPDGHGWWYEVRDPSGVTVAEAWRGGAKRYAQDEARRERKLRERRGAGAP